MDGESEDRASDGGEHGKTRFINDRAENIVCFAAK